MLVDGFGRMGKEDPLRLLRVDMKNAHAHWEPVPALYERLGGRALIAKLLLEEVPAACDALGPHNKLIFAPGILGGAIVSTAGRLSVGAKSPLTGGVKEANAGGTAGDALGKLAIKAVVVENQAQGTCRFVLRIKNDSAELLPADDLCGLGTYATADRLQQLYGSDTTVISIGQAGEYLMRGASIAITGERDQRSNHAARGGLGAVMGSKGLKAIVIDKPEGIDSPLRKCGALPHGRPHVCTNADQRPKAGHERVAAFVRNRFDCRRRE